MDSQLKPIETTIKLIWQKRVKFFALTATGTMLFLIYALLSPNWYQATVKIIPSEPNDNLMLRQYASIAAFAGVNIPLGAASQHYFYPEIIQSNFILDKVINLKLTGEDNIQKTIYEILDVDPDTTEEDWKFKLNAKIKRRLRNNLISTKIDELTEMISLTVELPGDRAYATTVVNFIINELDSYNRVNKKSKAKEQRKYIESAIRKNITSLREAEKKLIVFEINNKDLTPPEKHIQHNSIKMEVDIYYSLVKELKKQLELIKIEEIEQIPTLEIIEEAVPPFFKSKPKRLLIVLFGFLSSVFLAVGYILLQYYFSTNRDTLKKKFSSIFG